MFSLQRQYVAAVIYPEVIRELVAVVVVVVVGGINLLCLVLQQPWIELWNLKVKWNSCLQQVDDSMYSTPGPLTISSVSICSWTCWKFPEGDVDDDGDKDDNDWASGCSPLNLCRSELGTFRAEKPPWLQYKSINDDDDGVDVLKLMMGNADAGMMIIFMENHG